MISHVSSPAPPQSSPLLRITCSSRQVSSCPLPLLLPPPRHLHRLQSLPVTPARSRCRCHIRPILTVAAANPSSTPAAFPETQLLPLKIAIIGFGNFGQFLAKTLALHGHILLAHSRSDYSDVSRGLGVRFFADPHDLCEQHPDVIILSTSIISTQQVIRSLPLQRLKRNTLFVDVLSVKEFPKNLLLQLLPPDFDILCTHPMFGPESARTSWQGLNFAYEKVRVGDEVNRVFRIERFLDVFRKEGCIMVEMGCDEHDGFAAESQFITHTVGRVLNMLNLEATPIDTKGYEALLEVVENTASDSFDLYYGLFLYNGKALEVLERLDLSFEALRKKLFGRLHEVVRTELFGGYGAGNVQMEALRESNGVAVSVDKGHGYVAAVACSSGDVRRTKYVHRLGDSSIPIPKKITDRQPLKIAIVGFGNFGQFLAKTFVRRGHIVMAYSRTDYSAIAEELGVSFFFNADDLCEAHPEVILLCTSILSTEKVLMSLPIQRLKRSTLFVDVLSVKEFPRSLFLQNLPTDFDIICTHPMFGPDSGKNGWNDLAFVYDKVRIGNVDERISRCERFLDIFGEEGCRMVEMSCAEHDLHAAGSQFITHTVGRILEKLRLDSTPINTRGYETLLKLVDNTANDSFDLYYGLFMYNVNAMEQLERLDLAFESLKKQLFGQLHGVLRKKLFENPRKTGAFLGRPFSPKLNQDALKSASKSVRAGNI